MDDKLYNIRPKKKIRKLYFDRKKYGFNWIGFEIPIFL